MSIAFNTVFDSSPFP